ncbi:MAG: hypothetical protein ACLSGS_04240 [Adlercreutzia sp.]
MCWKHSGHGTLDLRGGIVQSCGNRVLDRPWLLEAARDGQVSQTALQDSREFHFDRYTGIDLGGESVGVIPRRNGNWSIPQRPKRRCGRAAT